ncbi:hypothetical protein B0J14DRAFT_678477 [Halenospora varia]|nr:hypothetical protein B0J14DRAFT_678477 [Halenospora varia]
MLCLNLPNGGVVSIYNKDIFKVLAKHTNPSSSASHTFKTTVMSNLTKGKAVSVDTGLLTGFAERKGGGWFERYVCHWTPLKDEERRVRWVVLIIAPKD